MKKVILISCLMVIYFAGVLTADETGVGAERNQDRTGSPWAASSTLQCDQCHSGGNFNAAIQLRLKDTGGNIVTEYNGGETYTYEVEVTGTGSLFGFQSVALLSSNDANAGLLTAVSSNAKITTLGGTRKYGEHTAASASGLYIMSWVAPAPGSGSVVFYASGNCVNNNNTANGDDAVLASPLIITESATSSVVENKVENKILIYPNPSESIVNISLEEAKKFKIQIFSIDGKMVYTSDINGSHFTLDISGWNSGMYYLIFSGEINQTESFIR